MRLWRWRTASRNSVARCALVTAILLRVISGSDHDGSIFGVLKMVSTFVFTNAGARCGSGATIRMARIIHDTAAGGLGFVNDGMSSKILLRIWDRIQEGVGRSSG